MNAVDITGIMVTGKSSDRFPLACRAVAAWLAQTYAPDRRKLLIVNDHPTESLMDHIGDVYGINGKGLITELRPQTRMSLGALRNLGTFHAETQYLVQWDDDDYSVPERLEWQIAKTQPGRASLLRYEVHCNLKDGTAFVNDGRSMRCRGFPGTMLWPRQTKCQFPEIGKREDTEFVMRLHQEIGVDVLTNDPLLYVRCFNGLNTWDEKHVMQRKAGSRELYDGERKRLNSILALPTPYIAEPQRA